MDIITALKNVEALANGIDPITGETLPECSPYNSPEVIRSLFTIMKLVKSPQKGKMSIEQKQEINIAKGLPKNAGLAWDDDERHELVTAFNNGFSINELSETHGRTKGAITSELKKQGLIEDVETSI
ncbi:hypothetical protein PVK64_19690 [Aliivibrio sp. S4TY2]|uniref:hypothetical protein n=1 Tax=Aliivibrio TaxID=511678 RepID=UPI000907FA4E|nr:MULTISPECIES: hypothetical protein [Aliivibrio]MDD9158391.1 hypothetical protein [Aliivibrio sp. S4TY2]MDD9162391.1 hypothetical protein [Aliivibrio sp. S4TY1]MDD9166398.1 hypothetical protein [Aliivibrio sp. S4MY2]MDD9170396.1 hypothetical protein [Aliivibrio sp. S4MY4]MDD9187494.1 hypothetical protein [Aliivibrio sp. S4MY3]